MITFALAVFFLIITPGPGVLSAAGVGAAYGRQAGLSYVTGLWVGNNLVGVMVITGLAAVILAVPFLRIILLVASTAYLGYLALRIATAGAEISFLRQTRQPALRDGVILQFINPKAYAVNTALYSSFSFLPQAYISEVIIKIIIVNVIWIPLHLIWLEAGVQLQKLSLSPIVTRRVNIAMAASLAAVVLLSLGSLVS